jgi:sugar transferase EpsL
MTSATTSASEPGSDSPARTPSLAHPRPARVGYRIAKRALDLVVACLVLVITFPLLAITAVVVRLRIGSPVLFRQTRPGLGGRPFVIYKFRTMTDEVDARGRQLPDEERLTRAGRVIRSMSLDELPQLWNVLRGDLSLVGPRPLLMAYLSRYTPEQARRMDVKPGITGWAQINGRNAITWERKFELDVWYVENQSFPLDLRILGRTLFTALQREGISQDQYATMPEFLGTQRTGPPVAGSASTGRVE